MRLTASCGQTPDRRAAFSYGVQPSLLAIGPPPAHFARPPSHDARPVAPVAPARVQRRYLGAERSCEPIKASGLPDATDLEGRGRTQPKPRRVRRIARAIPWKPSVFANRASAVQARNAANKMRFPASREEV